MASIPLKNTQPSSALYTTPVDISNGLYFSNSARDPRTNIISLFASFIQRTTGPTEPASAL
ncbi:hypothetical protein M422DRAFT_773966 [Sphaerobolus stellatus SS14]|nr:hypothetical protein M422DRAFT_773966 [Sphaerobolus stellatus SS14]